MSQAILLVEDDDNDVYFMRDAFREAGITNPLLVAQDGREAMDHLGGKGRYADRKLFPLPCLVLLDLKLPQVMGLEVLKWARAEPGLKTIIMIVLTSSQLVPDIEKAYQLGANAFLVKPSGHPELLKTVLGIKRFWLELNHGPAIGRRSPEPAATATEDARDPVPQGCPRSGPL